MKIQTRLLLLTTSTAVLAVALTLTVSSYLVQDSLESAAKEKLVAVLEDRHSSVARRLSAVHSELRMLAVTNAVNNHLATLTDAYAKLGSNAQTVLQQNYLAAGSDERTRQQSQITGTPYGKAESPATRYFRHHTEAYHWADIVLVDPQGNVVFSVLKEADFATNLVSGPYKDSGLAKAVVPLLRDAVPDTLSFADYSRHAPSKNEIASFLAMPVFDEVRQVFLGVVAIQLKNDQLDKIMHDKTGMGKSGEVLVIGKDGWMLSNSPHSDEATAFKQQIDTEASRMVLAGKSVVKDSRGQREIDLLMAGKPLTPFAGALGDKPVWGVIARISRAEVLEDYFRLRQTLLLTGGVLALLSLLLGYLGSRGITLPLLGIKDALAKLANGEICEINDLDRRDEIGEIGRAADSFRKMTQQVQHDHWLAANIAALTTTASAETTIRSAAERVLHLLCDQLDVPVGVIYMLEKGRYQRVSSHGLARRSQAENSLESDDGLLGQCAKDGQAIVLSPVPSGLSIISTGLVEFPPHELVLYPIKHKSDVIAVLELAATKSLDPVQHKFLKAACEALGLHLANLQVSEHNLELLAEMRKQSEQLHISAHYARSLLEASLDPLVTISAEGKITDVNNATEQATGAPRDKLIDSDFADYFTEPEKAREGYREVFSKGFVTDYPLAIRHASGKITDVLYNASVYRDARGNVLGVFAAARDITERKKAEALLKQQQDALMRSNEEMRSMNEEMRSQSEEMKAQNEELRASQEELRAQQEDTNHKNQMLEQQSQQLEEAMQGAEAKARELQLANQYKSEFLANMSHELRTPLNSVLILSKSLSENDEGNLTGEQVESATVISESGAQLLTLINDILDLSKIEAGKMELHRETFLLEELVTYLNRVFSPQAEKKRISLFLEVDSVVPATILTDRQRLTQILTNLLSNAVKFTDPGGEVRLKISQRDGDFQFEVIDSGIGIPAEKQEHIFGAFQQVDGSTSRKYGGSGLGLAISRHLTRLLGGDIAVDSESGRGSRFTVRLLNPFGKAVQDLQTQREQSPAATTQVAVGADAAATPLLSGKRILVVEDDPRLPAILKKMITALGVAPECVGSAELALESVAREKPAGILLDLGLPKMSGMALLRHLREDASAAHIPVFIMSGASDTGEAKALGAMGFLQKPITREKISAAIKAMIGEKRSPAPKRVLLVDENEDDVTLVGELFGNDRIVLVVAKSGAEALQRLQTERVDAVILGLDLPDVTAMDWLKQACIKLNPPPVIVFAAHELTEDEVFAFKEVAASIVSKGIVNVRLREEVLYAMRKTNTQASVAVNEKIRATGKKLLLVDDDARNLFALTKVLRGKGFDVEIAPHGAKALEMVPIGNYDAILTDIMMPEIDGYAVIRRVREMGYKDIPVIAITAKAMQGDDAACIEAGANGYMAKPVDVDALMAMLKTLGL